MPKFFNGISTADLRRAVFEREGGRCFWCDVEVRLIDFRWPMAPPPLDAATLDHIVPRVRKGETTLDNLLCACWACNQARGHMPANEYLRVVMLNRSLGFER